MRISRGSLRRGAGSAVMAACALLWPVPGRAQDESAVSGSGCAAIAMAPWTIPGGRIYRVAAVAAGRSCTNANVTLTIRGPTGANLLTFSSAAADLPLVFSEVTVPAGMTAALRRWIDQPAGGRTARDWPAWEAGQEEPTVAGRVFHPEPLVSRAQYNALRSAAAPAFCFLQGTESAACYALDIKAGTLTLVGNLASAG